MIDQIPIISSLQSLLKLKVLLINILYGSYSCHLLFLIFIPVFINTSEHLKGLLMSNYSNFSIGTIDELKDYILTMLGSPLVTVELADNHLTTAINEALETFTKQAQQERSSIALNLATYATPSGLLLPDNVTGIFTINDDGTTSAGDINRLFSFSNQMMNAGVVPFPGTSTFEFVTWQQSLMYLREMRRFLGDGFRFEFNPRTHYLKLYPDPILEGVTGTIVAGCNVIRPDSQQYGEQWVKSYALALSKIMLGQIREKLPNVQLLGGGNITQNTKAEGITERDALLAKLKSEEGGVYSIFIG